MNPDKQAYRAFWSMVQYAGFGLLWWLGAVFFYANPSYLLIFGGIMLLVGICGAVWFLIEGLWYRAASCAQENGR